MEKRIFIGGPPRSGTTLIRSLLNKHSQIGIAPETKLFWVYDEKDIDIPSLRNLTWILKGDARNSKQLPNYIKYMQNGSAEWQKFKRSELIDVLRNSFESNSRKQMMESLLSFYSPNKPIKGEKTPIHALYYKTIKQYYPDSYFIQMIRNPYAVCASALKKNFHGANSIQKMYVLLQYCYYWNWIANSGNEREKRDNKYLVISFESLIQEPIMTVEKICQFLGVDFEEQMMEVEKVNSSFEQKYSVGKSFSTDAIDVWRSYLNDTQKRIVNVICSHKSIYGY